MSGKDTEPNTFRIDELAGLAETTVRNVRSYQDRGLIPPPQRLGRVGLYSSEHLARLRLISSMLDRGYSLSNIGELFEAWEQGHNIGELLGFEAALAAPWTTETEVTLSLEELRERFGDLVQVDTLSEVEQLDLFEFDGEQVRVKSPRLLEAGAALVAAGVTVPAVVGHALALRTDIERIAERFVDLVEAEIIDPLGEPIPTGELPRLTELVTRLRPLAEQVVDAELARAIDRQIRARLSETMDRLAAQTPAAQTAAEDGTEADLQFGQGQRAAL
jgi:DNA-binding transcriptional MerR regulator